MVTKKVSMEDINSMNLSELNTVLTSGNLDPVLRQRVQVRIKSFNQESTPVEKVQEQVAQESVTAPVVKAPKNKPFETTRTIEKFADDTKGIRAGHMVTFTEHKGGAGKVLTGQVQRLFDFYLKPERQEAKIMVTNAKGEKTRYYRFEKDLAPVPVVPEMTEGDGI